MGTVMITRRVLTAMIMNLIITATIMASMGIATAWSIHP